MLLLRTLVARFWKEPYAQAAGALGHRAARPLHAAALRLERLRRRDRAISSAAGYPLRPRLVRALPGVPLPALRPPRSSTTSTSNCAGPSSPGMCWARRSAASARRATSTPRSSACRSRSRGLTERPPRAGLQRPAGAAAPHRAARRIRRRRALPRLAAALGAAPDHRRPFAAGVRYRRHLERPLHRRLHLPRRRTPAAAATTPSRSTPTRPSAAASAVSGSTGIRRTWTWRARAQKGCGVSAPTRSHGPWPRPWRSRPASTPAHWICAGSRTDRVSG